MYKVHDDQIPVRKREAASLTAKGPARTGGIKASQLQQSKTLGIFFARGLMQHNNFAGSLLLNHATPKVRGAGALRHDLNLVRRLDNSHFSLPRGRWTAGRTDFLDYDYYYSCSADANVKNMLKSSLVLWNTGIDETAC